MRVAALETEYTFYMYNSIKGVAADSVQNVALPELPSPDGDHDLQIQS